MVSGEQEQKWQANNDFFGFTDHKWNYFLVKMLCKIITLGFFFRIKSKEAYKN